MADLPKVVKPAAEHLTASQKACVAVDMLPWLEKGAKRKQETGKSQDGQAGGRGKKKNLKAQKPEGLKVQSTEPNKNLVAQMPQGLKVKSRDRAGKLLGIGGAGEYGRTVGGSPWFFLVTTTPRGDLLG